MVNIIDSNIKRTFFICRTKNRRGTIVVRAFYTTKVGIFNKIYGKSFDLIVRVFKKNNLHLTYLDYTGDKLSSINLPYVEPEVFKDPVFIGETERSWGRFAPLVKFYNISLSLESIQLGRVEYDSGVFRNILNGNIVYWQPYFEDTISKSSIKLKDNLVYYEYSKDIFILENSMQRHIPARLYENLYYNIETGVATCNLGVIRNNTYTEESGIFSTGSFSWDSKVVRAVPIVGYKNRS